MLSSLLVLTLASIAPFARAAIYITNPVVTTSLTAGQQGTIAWQDDNNGTATNLAAIGPCLVGLFVGSATQQTLLQTLGTSVDVSKNNSLTWTPDPTVGSSGPYYFIRFQSNSLKDPSNPANPYEAFSAKFTLSGMTGHFTDTENAEISGASAVVGASSTSGSATPAVASGSTVHAAATSGSPASTVKAAGSAAAATSSTSASSKKNGAGHMVVPRVLGTTGIAAVVFAFFL